MGQITLRELTPQLLPDWLAFFDHDAFADNPDPWSSHRHCVFCRMTAVR